MFLKSASTTKGGLCKILFPISGPFTCHGQATMIAYPIPRGATVIATPSMRGLPISPPLPIAPAMPGFNPEARPFFPTAPESPQSSLAPKTGWRIQNSDFNQLNLT